ncbi:hypothetical protein [Bradyrhizobium erythrophlei]|jgi:hypothetical protein|uniref:Uncharacterized protein n=1 Tax=Bradyrhizobium erythrophlei TaxID=1437360 RepID=A0A1M7UMH9_9BRAD|nr:hypothetical protein [Bradyrhizobium erythrophlei]SHN84154.1 hypothetical protein SAMN05444170_5797 [Bradyrhizobium erythrophlei]
MNFSNSAAGADQLSSQTDVPTSPAGASQMPRYGAEPERVPAISKAQAGGHCVTRRTAMNIAISSAALAGAQPAALADEMDDAKLLAMKERISTLYEKAHEHDEEIGRLHEITYNALREQNLPWEQVKIMPESLERDRLVRLSNPFHDEIEALVKQMWTIPASSSAAKAAKVWVLLHCVMGFDWLETESAIEWDIGLARELFFELAGLEKAPELRSEFADLEA